MARSEPMNYPVTWYHALTDTVEERIAWLRSATDDELTAYVEAHRAPSAHIARLVNENHDLRRENAGLAQQSRLSNQLLRTYREDDPHLRAIARAAVALRRGQLSALTDLARAVEAWPAATHNLPKRPWFLRLGARFAALASRLAAWRVRVAAGLRRPERL